MFKIQYQSYTLNSQSKIRKKTETIIKQSPLVTVKWKLIILTKSPSKIELLTETKTRDWQVDEFLKVILFCKTFSWWVKRKENTYRKTINHNHNVKSRRQVRKYFKDSVVSLNA